MWLDPERTVYRYADGSIAIRHWIGIGWIWESLTTDGAHHKQWYLERIVDELTSPISPPPFGRGKKNH